ncbi:hypothetical protein ASZ78_001477 [Callipepla squamata]|uniref:Uncharacterized protein n=1 Tax=Callipepla squamata TaxID=9009 RepID=A0A226MGH5_CALSU|nr:hypothetical protein ASZ78_001477 [Callipepla squamata]
MLVFTGISSLSDWYNSASYCINCGSIKELQFDWTSGWSGKTFGFLATVLCVLSIWSSYKVSCITQSTSKCHT